MRRFALAAILAISVAANATAAAPAFALRVVSYNVRKGTPAKQIAVHLRSVRADIIALQEVDRGTKRSGNEDQPTLLRNALGMHSHYAPSYRDDGGTTGMMILSRFPLSQTGTIRLPRSRNIGAAATVDIGGKKIRVYSFHLSATYRVSAKHYTESQQARELEAARITELAGKQPLPVIVAGDLNTIRGSRPYAIVTEKLTDCAAKLSPSPPPTFPAALPALRLDHVFVSKHFTPARATVSKGPSDHLMLVVDLAWSGKESD